MSEIQYGYRLCCTEAGQEGHEEHADYYEDYGWVHSSFSQDRKIIYINGHMAKRVQRTVTYGEWEDA